MNRSRTAFACGAVVLSLLAAGCSGDPKPRVAPEPSPSSTSPTATATGPVEPVMPEAAKAHTPAGAEAFVKYFWDVVNYAQATGETRTLTGLGPKCASCEAGASAIRQVYDHGGRIIGGEGRLVGARYGFVNNEGHRRSIVTCTVISTRQVVDLTDSRKVYPASSLSYQFLLDPAANGWAMVTFGKQ